MINRFPGLLFREIWRTGQLRLFAFTLMFVVASFAASEQIFQQLQASLGNKVAELMGSDREIASSREIPKSWIEKSNSFMIEKSSVVDLGSMLGSEDGFQLSSVSAVDNNYPLRGELLIGNSKLDTKGQSMHAPETGNLWLSLRLASSLNVDLGSSISIGETELIVSGLIISEPGNTSGMAGLAPRALINLQDLHETGLIRPGSRVRYRLLMAGQPKQLEAFKALIEAEFEPGDEWKDPQASTSSSKLLDRIKSFLGITTLIALLMGIAALALAGYRFAEQQRPRVALWRCLGASRAQLIKQYTVLLIIVGLGAGIVGEILGLWLSDFVLMLLAEYLPVSEQAIGLSSLLIPILTGILLIAAFLYPAIIQTINRPPLSVIRPESGNLKVPWLHWIPGLMLIASIALYWSSSIQLWLFTVAALIILWGILLFAATILIKIFKGYGNRTGGAIRLVSSLLNGTKTITQVQLVVVSLILSMFGIVLLASQGLLQQWQQELPQETPNLFLFNVSEKDVEPIKQKFAAKNITQSEWYPIARGRMYLLNGEPIKQALPESSKEDNSLKRELNLTWTDTLGEDNKILEGVWPPKMEQLDDGGEISGISVESGLAKRLQLVLGQDLTFRVGAQVITGKITSIREVHWDSFRPNFFVIFAEPAFDKVAVTYLSSFYIPQTESLSVENLLRDFPTVSMIPVDKVLDQVRQLIAQAGLILQLSMIFIAVLAITLVLSVLQITYQERLMHGLVIRAVGGGNRFIKKLLLIEWTVLALVAGFVSALFIETLYALIATGLLQLSVVFHPLLWLLMPILAFIILFLSGQGLRQRLLGQSPMQLLKES
jgi:putative ABC transport system permease protein